ncbi:E3 ubiquitin-protein ligase CHIP isoform X1 [Dermacentor silvarum]|uniref:E3 ubiquitin-protein ligase CHIP isoform X1 n=1 Tax=Dermacentor silvarum TaxID=543639 RepID=UPI0018980C9D|nr:E3 ubiquitin-protein ligase CHIP isoform X1 [Dermacentor silvarum]
MKDTMTAIELKDLGNKLFSARKYEDAISCYSKAIIKSPSTATYFTNRALCYLKLQQWELACQDCRRALDLDPSSVKGHFFLGQALQEMDNYDEAVKYLQRANDLAREQKLNFGDDIACQLRLARKRRWQLIEEKRLQQEIELQTYLNQLILLDKQKRVQEMKMKGTRQADIRTGGGCPGQVHIRVEQHICKGGRQAQEARRARLPVRQDQLRDHARARHHAKRDHLRPPGHRGAPTEGRPLRPSDENTADPGPADSKLGNEGGGGRLPCGKRVGPRLLRTPPVTLQRTVRSPRRKSPASISCHRLLSSL